MVEPHRAGPGAKPALVDVNSFFPWIILAAGLSVVVPASHSQPCEQTAHSGKTVGEWFQMYVAGAGTRVSPATPARNGEFIRLTPDDGKPDPAWQAFDALGERAVPCLVLHLRSGSADSD